jgi:hypothetical protein
MNSDQSTIHAAIDRFEGDDKVYAVIELPDLDHALIPAQFIPSNANEGDWLEITFKIDPAKKEEIKNEIINLQKKASQS